MSVSTFPTPSPIAVVLDLYVAEVRFVATDRTDTVIDVRPGDPDRAADVKAAENTRVEYEEATRTLSVTSRKPRSRFVNFSSKPSESISILIELPTDSAVRGETDLGDFTAEGALGPVALKTDLGAVRLAETGPLNLRNGVGEVTVNSVNGELQLHTSSSDIRIGTVDGAADILNSNGTIRVGLITGAAGVKAANGPVRVDRALSDITASSSNGEVRIGEVVRGKVSATSKNGSVEIGVREGSAAWLELNTTVGRVYNELTSADAPAEDEPVEKVEIQAGTKLGDITIRRVPRPGREG